jgi:hypothetical protein
MAQLQSVFYRAADGAPPVDEFIESLPVNVQVVLDNQIDRLNDLTDAAPHRPPPGSRSESRAPCGARARPMPPRALRPGDSSGGRDQGGGSARCRGGLGASERETVCCERLERADAHSGQPASSFLDPRGGEERSRSGSVTLIAMWVAIQALGRSLTANGRF